MPFAIVEVDMRSTPERIDYEIQGPIPVYIHQGSAGGVEVGAANAGPFGNVFEFPIAPVSVQTVARFQAAEIEIAPTITIDIAGSHARAARQDLTRQHAVFGQSIGKKNPRFFR